MKVGVLALQGDVEENVEILKRAFDVLKRSEEIMRVKDLNSLKRVDGLVIPGGEFTTIGRLIVRRGLLEPLKDMAKEGFPIFGIGAGAMILAKKVKDRIVGEIEQMALGVMDVEALRNAFGRQRESFETEVYVNVLGRSIRGAFIRAPAIVNTWGGARSLATIECGDLGRVTALVEQGSLLASIFHPEITGDPYIHAYFINMISK